MGIEVLGQVGPQQLGDGATVTARMGRLADIVLSQLQARYYEQTFRGNIFLASLQANVAISALSATATGLILTNPANSGKNLVLLDLAIAFTASPAAASTMGLAANVNPVAAAVVHTTPLIIRAALLGAGTSSVALADSAATLPAAPIMIRAIGGGPVASGSITAPFIRDEIAGNLILAPGTAVSLASLGFAMNALATISWAEVAI